HRSAADGSGGGHAPGSVPFQVCRGRERRQDHRQPYAHGAPTCDPPQVREARHLAAAEHVPSGCAPGERGSGRSGDALTRRLVIALAAAVAAAGPSVQITPTGKRTWPDRALVVTS